MRVSCYFVETWIFSIGWVWLRTRASHLELETQRSRSEIGRTRVSRLELETRVSHSETGKMRISHFGACRMQVSRLTWTSRCWITWDSHSGTKAQSTRCLNKTRVWTSCSESTEQIASAEFSMYCWQARWLHWHSIFWLSHKGCWEPSTTWNYKIWRGEWWQNWFSPSLWSCAKALALRVP